MPLHPATIRAFRDESEKIAMDPLAMAGLVAGGKIMATNALTRFGMKVPAIRRMGQEVAGVGLRTAMQGKPMLSAPLRHTLAVGVDPKMVSLYEHAHDAGRAARQMGAQPAQVEAMRHMLAAHPAAKQFSDMGKFVSGIPLHSTGLRKAVDYGFTPVKQVGRDIASGARRLMGRFRPNIQPSMAPPIP